MPSKFKATRERKRKVIARQNGASSAVEDSNPELITASKTEREERRIALREQLHAQQSQPKISAKKAKRLDKYVEKKLQKDEAADLVRKLEKERERFDAASAGLQSSKQLKRKFTTFVDGQVNGETSVEHYFQPSLKQQRRAELEDEVESVDSFEEDHADAFDPAQAPAQAADDDAWLQKKAAPKQGTGLAQPLTLGADGIPVIPKRRERVQTQVLESDESDEESGSCTDAAEQEDWNGFSASSQHSSQEESDAESDSESVSDDEIDARLRDIDGDVLDQLLAEMERSEESYESDESQEESQTTGENNSTSQPIHSLDDLAIGSESGSQSEDDSEEESETSETSEEAKDVRIKPRASAFKSWATQQLNQSIGHTPFYDQEQNPDAKTVPQVFEKPAAGFKLGLKELPGPKPDRRAYTIPVTRSDAIQESRSQLPILQNEQEIMEAIHNNPVVVIKGETGSGKTTQIPQFLFEAGFGDKNGSNPGMIGVTQPRRVAAVSMAKRVAEELGDQGQSVAHQIRFDTTVSSKTAVKFMTDGILLRELSQDLLLKKYSAIVVDEAHERSVNTDLLIGLLSKVVPARMKKMPQNPEPKPLKLIIMSATLKIEDFLHEKLFAASLRPPIVTAEGRQHKVTIHFALRSRADYLEEIIEKVKRAHRKLPRGGILVFLTGQNEIRYVLSQLRQDLLRSARSEEKTPKMYIAAKDAPLEMDDMDFGAYDATDRHITGEAEDDIDILVDEDEADKEFEIPEEEEESQTYNTTPHSRDPYDSVHLLPLYSQLPTLEQMKVFVPPPDRSRMIVLATNVAETSLTIPGIRYVFDCGRSKEKKFNIETNVQSFEIDYISKASAQQRAGRAGRTGPGHCWRLYSSAVYEQFFPNHTEPEILRTPAESVVLQVKDFRYPKPVIEFPFPSPPKAATLQKSEKLLKDLGAIDKDTGLLTGLGNELSLYPLSPRLGKIVVLAIKNPKILANILMLVSALSVDDVFVNETQLFNQEDDDDERDSIRQAYGRARATFSKQDKSSDAMKLLTAVQMYLGADDKSSFCQQYFLRSKAMAEIAQLYGQLRNMVQANNPSLGKVEASKKLNSNSINAINQTMAAGFIDQIALRYDRHPTPPVLPRHPTRAIDTPYLPLTPLRPNSAATDIIDQAVFIHPSSLLSKFSKASLPEYIVYRHLQTSQTATIEGDARQKTRMFPICAATPATVLEMVRETGLIEYGKPVAKTKVEELTGTKPRERVCWATTELKSQTGSVGWPLPPTRVRQVLDMKSASGWRVVEILA